MFNKRVFVICLFLVILLVIGIPGNNHDQCVDKNNGEYGVERCCQGLVPVPNNHSFSCIASGEDLLSDILDIAIDKKNIGINVGWKKNKAASSYIVYRGKSEDSLKPISIIENSTIHDYQGTYSHSFESEYSYRDVSYELESDAQYYYYQVKAYDLNLSLISKSEIKSVKNLGIHFAALNRNLSDKNSALLEKVEKTVKKVRKVKKQKKTDTKLKRIRKQITGVLNYGSNLSKKEQKRLKKFQKILNKFIRGEYDPGKSRRILKRLERYLVKIRTRILTEQSAGNDAASDPVLKPDDSVASPKSPPVSQPTPSDVSNSPTPRPTLSEENTTPVVTPTPVAEEQAPSCNDSVKNGNETDVDCGGSCSKCGTAQSCVSGSGCTSGVCQSGKCKAPTCSDNVKNGNETDIDCGGSCKKCLTGQTCQWGAECSSGSCYQNKCLPDFRSVSSAAKNIIGYNHAGQETWYNWVQGGRGLVSGDYFDNYQYDPAHADHYNHINNYSDVSATTNDGVIKATLVTSLAGAIGSVKFRNQELISATHGAAFQYHVRYSDIGFSQFRKVVGDSRCPSKLIKNEPVWTLPADLNECDNPTEAGHDINTDWIGSRSPQIFLKASSSALHDMAKDTYQGFPRLKSVNSPVDFIAPQLCSVEYDNGAGRCFNSRKPEDVFYGFKFDKKVSMGWRSNIDNINFHNVMKFDTTVEIPVKYRKKLVQIELAGYLTRWAINEYSYDAVTNTLTGGAAAAGGGSGVGGEKGMAKIFSNPTPHNNSHPDYSFAMGMISFYKKGAKIARDNPATADIYEAPGDPQPYIYTQRLDTPYAARLIQSTWYFSYPPPSVDVTTFVAFGTMQEVRNTLQHIVKAVRQDRSLGLEYNR